MNARPSYWALRQKVKSHPLGCALLPSSLSCDASVGSGVAVANAMDLGDAQAPYGSVHPRNKTAVAARLGTCGEWYIYLR